MALKAWSSLLCFLKTEMADRLVVMSYGGLSHVSVILI